MADRVDATITIGGPVPAGRLEELLDAIESERLGRDWEERFASRDDLVHYLRAGAARETDQLDLVQHCLSPSSARRSLGGPRSLPRSRHRPGRGSARG